MFNTTHRSLGWFTAILLATATLAHAEIYQPSKFKAKCRVTGRTFIADPADPAKFGQPFLILTTEQTGVDSEIGKLTITSTGLVHLELQEGKIVLVVEGTYEGMDQNGDKIFGVYRNERVNGENHFIGYAHGTGGTGRWQGRRAFESMFGVFDTTDDFRYTSKVIVRLPGTASEPDRCPDPEDED